MTAALALAAMRASNDYSGTGPADLVELLRRRAGTIIAQELRRLEHRAPALSDDDLGKVGSGLDELVERMLLSRLRAAPHLSTKVAALFASASDQAAPAQAWTGESDNPTSGRPGRSPSHGWMDQAACRSADPELFYPIGETGLAIEQIDAAKAVCDRCPVKAECLAHALATGEAHGVWGGATPDERRAIRRLTPLDDRGAPA